MAHAPVVQANVVVAILLQEIQQLEKPVLRRFPEFGPVDVIVARDFIQGLAQLLQEVGPLAFAQKYKTNNGLLIFLNELT